MSVIAFRRWRVDCATLYGVGVPVSWPPGPQTAECHGCRPTGYMSMWGPSLSYTCSDALPPGHHAPSLHSRCGIWAHKQPIRPCQCPTPTAAVHGAVGAVRLWGRYVEHETGWRAQHAQLVALVDYNGYVAPSYDAPRYPDLESMYAEWAPDATGWAPGEPPGWCGWAGLPRALQMAFAAAQFRAYAYAEAARLFDHLDQPERRDQQPEQRRAELLAELRARHQHGPWLDQPERRRRRP